MPLLLEKSLVCIDIESTGLDVVSDRIVELALVKLDPSGIRKTKVFRINPQRNIPKDAIDVHGITDEMIKDAPKFSDVANEVKQFIGDADLCGYNCLKFDVPMLVEEFLRAGIPFSIEKCKIIDAQRIFHKYEPRDLAAAYKFYCQKTIENHHSAQADAQVTMDVLLAQVEKYTNLGKKVSEIAKNTALPNHSLDLVNRIVEKDGIPVFNFGKHKGKPVSLVFREEPQYYDWIMKNEFSLHTKQVLSSLYAKMSLSSS